MKNFLTSDQNRGIAKGFGLGLGGLFLTGAGLFLWSSLSGPDVVKTYESRLVSRTIVMERVLPISPTLRDDVEKKTPTPEHTAETKHTSPTHTEEPAKPVKAPDEPGKHEPKVTPAPVDSVIGNDPQLKDLQRYTNGMVIAPVKELLSEQGHLPIKRADGLTPFKAYKSPLKLKTGNPVISIAVADMGISNKLTETAIKILPPEVSLIVSPYAATPESWVTDARKFGHEVWLSLPMESSLYPRMDTGPQTLLVGAPERENLQKLTWVMGRASGYAGLVANYNDIFMNAANDARPILSDIFKRGLAFADSGGAGGTAQATAVGMNAPYTNINVWIDKPDNTPETIKASLSQMEIIARENGFAAGVISANNVGFREIKSWLETLDDKGFVLAPLSAQTGQ